MELKTFGKDLIQCCIFLINHNLLHKNYPTISEFKLNISEGAIEQIYSN